MGIGVATWLASENDRRAAALKCLVESFRAQTWQNWRMLIVHDGPHSHDHGMRKYVEELTADSRVRLMETPERKRQFGHPYRQQALNDVCSNCHWVMLTNDDNYYAPVFLEWLLFVGTTAPKPGCDLVYCDMVHSHKYWKPMITQPRYKHIDLGGFIVKSSVAKQVPFDKYEFNGDGDWINRLVAKCQGKVQKVSANLFIHN